MVRGAQAVFRYKTIKGPLHKLPAMLKLFLLLPLCVLFIYIPYTWLIAGIITSALTALLCGFTLREQLTDFKPAAFYAVFMYAVSVSSVIIENWQTMPLRPLAEAALMPRPDFLRVSLRLVLIVQLSALFFRTVSSAELREGLTAMEQFIRRILKAPAQACFSQAVCLFLCFIPEIFETWAGISLAWKARGGREGLTKIKTLVFVLISISFEKAAVKAKAIEAREKLI